MNKTRIIGLVLLIAGVILQFTLENDFIDFISGMLIGAGIVLLISGRMGKKIFIFRFVSMGTVT